MKVYQLNNGRWQVTVEYDMWNKLSHSFIAAILWRSFNTQDEAKTFAATVVYR